MPTHLIHLIHEIKKKETLIVGNTETPLKHNIIFVIMSPCWPWPKTVTKVKWWSHIIGYSLIGFLCPGNHILDTEITSLSLIDPEINHVTLLTLTKYGYQGHVMVPHYWLYLIWIPWPWKPYPRRWNHLSIINRSWDNLAYVVFGGHLGFFKMADLCHRFSIST